MSIEIAKSQGWPEMINKYRAGFLSTARALGRTGGLKASRLLPLVDDFATRLALSIVRSGDDKGLKAMHAIRGDEKLVSSLLETMLRIHFGLKPDFQIKLDTTLGDLIKANDMRNFYQRDTIIEQFFSEVEKRFAYNSNDDISRRFLHYFDNRMGREMNRHCADLLEIKFVDLVRAVTKQTPASGWDLTTPVPSHFT